jgi:RNA recognition motif-containing protein
LSSKLFVGNLEFSTTREQLDTLFSEVGTIVDLFLPSDRATGKPRGFAFVEFASETEANAAIQKFDGYELNGRSLRVNQAEARAPRPPRFDGGGGGGGYSGFSPDRQPFGGGGGGGGKSKGSRRNLRAKKRSL